MPFIHITVSAFLWTNIVLYLFCPLAVLVVSSRPSYLSGGGKIINYKISVFTPPYNRGDLINRVYSSLVEQTFKGFEWIIVEDGSTDQTGNLISKLKSENKVNIFYCKFQNRAENRTINKGVFLSNGELFFVVDNDDYIINNVLELIVYN